MDCIRFDRDSSSAFVDGRWLRLTDIEYAILERLVQEGGGVVRASDLTRAAYGSDTRATSEALRQRVNKLRSKVGGWHIRNAYGLGYRYE